MPWIVRLITPAAQGGKHKGIDAFKNELLDELGWGGDNDFNFDVRWAENDNKKLDDIAKSVAQDEGANVIITDGSMATSSAYKYAMRTTAIIQAVGGFAVADSNTYGNLTGYFINTLRTCMEQLPKLGPTDVTVLFDTTNTAAQDIFNALGEFSQTLLIKKNLLPVDIHDVAKFDDKLIKGDAFMLIPNAIYYNSATEIGKAVQKKDVPAIYPEREYRKGHTDKNKAKVHGHQIPFTFRLAARIVDKIANGKLILGFLDPIKEADQDQIS